MRVGIIGAGIHGAATAYFLKKHGVDDVIVFDKDHPGNGSTGYSAGIIRFHYTNQTQIQLAMRGHDIIKNLEKYVGQDGGFHNNGYLVLYRQQDEKKLQEIVSRQRACGVDVRLVGADELESYFSGISTEDGIIGAYEPDAGFADPYLVTSGFVEKAKQLGVTFHVNTEVTGLSREGDTVTSIDTPTDTYNVDYVINAAGQFASRVADMVDISIPLNLCESKIAVLESEHEYSTAHPTLADHTMATDFYTKPESSGHFIVGGIDRPQVGLDERKTGVNEEFLLEVIDRLEQRLPSYTDASVVESWSGKLSITPDSNLIIGEPEPLQNFYNLVGGSGHGFKTGPAFAEAVAKDILGKDVKYDLSQYRLERFDEDDLLDGVSSKTYSV
ncbi:NAD(P)/FAD-dependent oxidoreductase [Natrarchaeobius chitinivorans]|uniref:FAD-binding oxidoreductase n=1 Tax=Natrarchaeobius chitinivorans TaxID=1679083 RepID=A0A3N6MLY4_NATCH|nr:FAD-dependent oxidoreductase [Natrarchaeobius chitinivorans]RQG95416.1 FAD-binding oxidoreductase [Natrarchaeobius chitinivorans]